MPRFRDGKFTTVQRYLEMEPEFKQVDSLQQYLVMEDNAAESELTDTQSSVFIVVNHTLVRFTITPLRLNLDSILMALATSFAPQYS